MTTVKEAADGADRGNSRFSAGWGFGAFFTKTPDRGVEVRAVEYGPNRHFTPAYDDAAAGVGVSAKP